MSTIESLERALARQSTQLENIKFSLVGLSRDKRKRLAPADVVVRAATVELLRQQVGRGNLESRADALQRVYNGCQATAAYFEKAAVNPANTTVAGWAAELVGVATADFVATDLGASAFAQLAERALVVTLPPGAGVVKIPGRASPQVLVGAWIGESSAKPVYQGAGTTTSVTPFKLAALSVFSEEMLEVGTTIEAVLREVLAHDLTALLDSALLDAAAASAVRPAGLWNGATAVTASTATPLADAMVKDLQALHAQVANGNPDAKTVFVVNPQQAARVSLTAPQYQNVIVSGYQTAGSVGAVDASAVAMLLSQPEFALSRSAAIHMDTSPLPLSAPGTPNTVVAPIRSTFQEDTVALRSVLRTGWAKRRTGATALIASGVTW